MEAANLLKDPNLLESANLLRAPNLITPLPYDYITVDRTDITIDQTDITVDETHF